MPFRVKSSGWRSCGGHSKWNGTSSTRRSRTWAVRKRARREPPPLTQGPTPLLHHPQTLCWSPAPVPSQKPPPAPTYAIVIQNWKHTRWSGGGERSARQHAGMRQSCSHVSSSLPFPATSHQPASRYSSAERNWSGPRASDQKLAALCNLGRKSDQHLKEGFTR